MAGDGKRLRQAAEAGDVAAMAALAELFYHHELVALLPWRRRWAAEAERWYRRAAEAHR